MKTALFLSISIVLLLFATPTIHAQDEPEDSSGIKAIKLDKGTVEISANFTGTVFGFATIPSINYSITDTIQISCGFYYENGTSDDFDYEAMGASFFGVYNFYPKNLERLVPFVQTGYNIASFNFDRFDLLPISLEDVEVVDSSGPFIGGGARYFLNDNVSVNIILTHQFGDAENTRFGIGVSAFIFK